MPAVPPGLLAALLAAAPAAPPPPAPAPPSGSAALWDVLGNFDEYPGATPYQVADQMKVGSAQLRMAGFATSDPPAKILDFYRAEFAREKLFVPPGPPPEGIPVQGLTGFDPRSNLEKTVMVFDGSGGPTRVVLSVSPEAGLDSKALAPATEAPAGLPVFPKSSDLYRTDAEDGAHTSSTISYRAGATPAAILEYVRGDLTAKGWTQASAANSLPGTGLRYLRPGESVDITLYPIDLASTEVTYVYVH